MDKLTHIKADQLDFAIGQLSEAYKTLVLPRAFGNSSDCRGQIYDSITKEINKKTAAIQKELIAEALEDLKRQYDEL